MISKLNSGATLQPSDKNLSFFSKLAPFLNLIGKSSKSEGAQASLAPPLMKALICNLVIATLQVK